MLHKGQFSPPAPIRFPLTLPAGTLALCFPLECSNLSFSWSCPGGRAHVWEPAAVLLGGCLLLLVVRGLLSNMGCLDSHRCHAPGRPPSSAWPGSGVFSVAVHTGSVAIVSSSRSPGGVSPAGRPEDRQERIRNVNQHPLACALSHQQSTFLSHRPLRLMSFLRAFIPRS